jgi:hypothetical protein
MKSIILVMTALFFCTSVYAGSYIKDYSSGKRLLEFDGSYVKEYSSGKRLLEFSGSYVKAYSSGERLMESTGVIPRVVVALIVLQGL